MKFIITILIFFICTSCCNYDYDYTIAPLYREQLNIYKKGSLIVFKGNLNDSDTIMINGLDSVTVCGSAINIPFKEIFLNVSNIEKSNRVNDKLLTVYKEPLSKDYSVSINYKGFIGELNMQSLLKNELDTIRYQPINTQNDEYIVEIYWSRKLGMTGYKDSKGQQYIQIKN